MNRPTYWRELQWISNAAVSKFSSLESFFKFIFELLLKNNVALKSILKLLAKDKRILKKRTPSLQKHNERQTFTKPVNVQVVPYVRQSLVVQKVHQSSANGANDNYDTKEPIQGPFGSRSPMHLFSCGRKRTGSVTGWRETRWNVDAEHIPFVS